MHPSQSSFEDKDPRSAAGRVLRFVPAPHSAAEHAAMDAALEAQVQPAYSTKARILVTTALVAGAVTIPDISVGAMDSPFKQIELSEPKNVVQQNIWSPSAGATTPVYAPVMAAEEIAPSALTFSSRSSFADFDEVMPLAFLETGSEAFDLAFAGVEMPTPVSFTVSRGAPQRIDPIVQARSSAIRTQIIDVPQISGLPSYRPAPARNVREAGSTLAPGASVERSVAAANESVAAAFAGTLDVSGSALPGTPSPNAPTPSREAVARAVPIPVPSQTLAQSAREQTELVAKSRLDARINGVVTGKVDFRQLDGTIAIRLGSVVDMLRNRFSQSELDAIMGAGALDSYVTLAELQSAGVPISYDPIYDEVEFGVDYNDAPQAVKVQVEQIGPPTFRSDTTMIDQIPR